MYRVTAKIGQLLVCNRSGGGGYRVKEFRDMAEAIGYHVLIQSVARDKEEVTGVKERYLLVLQK